MTTRTLQFITLAVILTSRLQAADLTSTYEWKPINIGAGGWATGIISSQSDPNVRFVRTDTGQFYRWGVAENKWLPMVVQNDDGTGFGKEIVPEPSHSMGAIARSFALDPNDNNTIYLYLSFYAPGSGANFSSLPYNVYKSVDGGKNFVATRFNDATKFTMKANEPNFEDWPSARQDDDCIAVDPNNSKVVYVGTGTKGMFRSADAGNTWSAMTGGGLPITRGKNDINILPYKKGGTTTVNGVTASKIIYLVYAKGLNKNNQDAEGNVYRSEDGGQSWVNITKDTGPSEVCRSGVLDQNNGVLYVRTQVKNFTKRCLWKYENGTWSMLKDDVTVMTVDPTNSNNLVVSGSVLGFSTDAGKTWKTFKAPYPNFSVACTRQQGISGAKHVNRLGHSCYSKMLMDSQGTVWLINGNEAVLSWKFDPHATEMVFNPNCAGVENLCGSDIVFPKNWGGKVLVSCGDENGFVVNNLDVSDITLVLPESGATGYGLGITLCPNDPNTFCIHGYHPALTTDGGKTFELNGFRNLLASQMKLKRGWGNIQVSRRGDWAAGADHLVALFSGAAWYSKDGGKNWTQSKSDFSKVTVVSSPWVSNRNVVADPFIPDKFYGCFGEGGFWTTTDGGETWIRTPGPAANANYDMQNNQLRANDVVQNDLWLTTKNSMYHSIDAGANWTEVLGHNGLPITYWSKIALGKGSGKPGDAPYTVYYVYRSDHPAQPAKDCGIYRSTNAGASWDRIAQHPCGFLCLDGIGASWDTFGLVGLTISGQSYAYGKLK